MNRQAFPPTLPERGKFSSNMSTVGMVLTSSQVESPLNRPPSQPQHVFTASGLAAKKTVPTAIYKWEANNSKNERSEVVIGNKTFIPSNYNAIYTAAKSTKSAEKSNSQEYIDFQVVLTKEEMEVLAARRKKLYFTATANAQTLSSMNGIDKSVHKSHVASMSLSKSTPYVDPSRIQSELLVRR